MTDYELIEDINQRHKRKTVLLEQKLANDQRRIAHLEMELTEVEKELAAEIEARIALEQRVTALANKVTFNDFNISDLAAMGLLAQDPPIDSDYACTEA